MSCLVVIATAFDNIWRLPFSSVSASVALRVFDPVTLARLSNQLATHVGSPEQKQLLLIVGVGESVWTVAFVGAIATLAQIGYFVSQSDQTRIQRAYAYSVATWIALLSHSVLMYGTLAALTLAV